MRQTIMNDDYSHTLVYKPIKFTKAANKNHDTRVLGPTDRTVKPAMSLRPCTQYDRQYARRCMDQ